MEPGSFKEVEEVGPEIGEIERRYSSTPVILYASS